LDIINKQIDIQKTKQFVRLLRENDIEVRLYMIIGLPGEPKDIVEQTWNFIEETDPALVYLSLLTIRPGTELFNNPKKFGIKKINTNWDETMHMHGRYEKEIPRLTFEYEENTPWGKGFSKEKIVDNYLELQTRIKESGRGPH